MSSGIILGLHLGHDATATLINQEGKVLAAIAEERLTRVKYHMGFPFMAIEEVLRIAMVTKSEVQQIALSTENLIFPGTPEYNRLFFLKNPSEVKGYDIYNRPNQLIGKWNKIFRQLPFRGSKHSGSETSAKELTLSRTREVLEEIGLGHCQVESFDHHKCHAASAVYSSGKANALVITMDGAGDGNCATAYQFKDGMLNLISSASSDVSPGRFYSEITGFCGFKRLRHEGKITGLAARGDSSKHYSQLKEFIWFDSDTEQFKYKEISRSKLNSKMRTIKRILNDQFTSPAHVAEFYDFLKSNFDPQADMADLAAAAQRILEELAVEYVNHFKEKTGEDSILLAGGIFANVRVNQEVSRISGVDHVFIHQNMGDGGLSLGAAFLMREEKKNVSALRNVYLGPEFTDEEIEQELSNSNIKFQKIDDIEKTIAELIHNGKVIGRFNGRMEYGPRALGNRSIIGSPTDRSINDWLNKKLNRTEFMPFAPSIISEKANDVLVGYNSSNAKWADRFMTITYNVEKEWQERTQATTHIDGTARPQVVHKEDNPSYHKIIAEYEKLSGIPLVINTSFNIHEEPIVATPADAIRAFHFGCLDYLAIGNFLCNYDDIRE